jgi:hypothetical protein
MRLSTTSGHLNLLSFCYRPTGPADQEQRTASPTTVYLNVYDLIEQNHWTYWCGVGEGSGPLLLAAIARSSWFPCGHQLGGVPLAPGLLCAVPPSDRGLRPSLPAAH